LEENIIYNSYLRETDGIRKENQPTLL